MSYAGIKNLHRILENEFLRVVLISYILLSFFLLTGCQKKTDDPQNSLVTFTVLETGLYPGNTLSIQRNNDSKTIFSHTNPISNSSDYQVRYTYEDLHTSASVYTVTLLPVTGPIPQTCWFTNTDTPDKSKSMTVSISQTTLIVT